MKKIKKRILVFCLTLLCLLSFSSTAFAYELLGTGSIVGGADNLKYWRHSNMYEYRHSLGYGIEKWNGISSQISVSSTTVKSSSQCDNYWGEYFPSGSLYIAYVWFYRNATEITDHDNDWYWCIVKYNSESYNYDEIDYQHRKAIACHEFGHFLGLAHNNSSVYNIMYQYGEDIAVEAPSTDDKNGAIAIYGS